MYYDATDFPTRSLVEPVFLKNKKSSLKAIDNRIKHKRKNETTDMAPFSDLLDLKNQLMR